MYAREMVWLSFGELHGEGDSMRDLTFTMITQNALCFFSH